MNYLTKLASVHDYVQQGMDMSNNSINTVSGKLGTPQLLNQAPQMVNALTGGSIGDASKLSEAEMRGKSWARRAGVVGGLAGLAHGAATGGFGGALTGAGKGFGLGLLGGVVAGQASVLGRK